MAETIKIDEAWLRDFESKDVTPLATEVTTAPGLVSMGNVTDKTLEPGAGTLLPGGAGLATAVQTAAKSVVTWRDALKGTLGQMVDAIELTLATADKTELENGLTVAEVDAILNTLAPTSGGGGSTQPGGGSNQPGGGSNQPGGSSGDPSGKS
ncbi:hypothetical protein [Actinomadura rupiterrae]|uniref:hypothetical protein n=1 Tax=Actinomadura rupiterrae TaxID=559627 RepID=UPI0020A3E4FB|nr:hypothetical protein [Actinomadura rupiterrae]MCP2336727.1 hypothetical protein [Actinomadura rupiterrae]